MVCEQGIRAGQYAATKARVMHSGAYDLAGRTLGIVGFGRIGRQVARRAIPFELNTIYYDIVRPTPEEEREYQVTFVELPELLRRADILTVHVPLDASTYHLIGEAELRQLRSTAIVINAARGPIVDPAPLAQMVGDGLGWSGVARGEPATGRAMRYSGALILVVVVLLGACASSGSAANKPAAAPGGTMQSTPSGLQYEDLVVGTGDAPRQGQTAVVH